jgi:hypothetical protein|tara:strand:+ start:48 stop:317 length:270 start_codon:yes stop_codon:yes gene_type:complete
MIKLKKLIIKEEVDKKKLKNALKNVAEANVVLIKALSEFFEIFTRHHGTAQAGISDPMFLMINKIINLKGKINKLYAWKKHFAKLEKKL